MSTRYFYNNLFYASTSDATNSSLASVVIAGGLSIQKNVIVSQNLTVGNIMSSGITTGNINFTGTLYQNNTPYIGSQWTGSNGNLLYYGSTGSTYVGINTSTPTFNLDVSGGARITTGLIVGNVTVGGNMIPDTNIIRDLGSPTNRWRDLYLSGNTIDLGGTLISSTPGSIVFGSTVLTTTTEGNIVSSIPNLVATTINASTGITVGSILLSSGNLNISSGELNVSGNISSASTISGNVFTGGSLQISGTTSSLVFTGGSLQISGTTSSLVFTGGSLQISGTTSSLVFTGGSLQISGTTSTGTLVATNSVFTNISTGTLRGTDLFLSGTLTTVNITTQNILVSTGYLLASSSTLGSLLVFNTNGNNLLLVSGNASTSATLTLTTPTLTGYIGLGGASVSVTNYVNNLFYQSPNNHIWNSNTTGVMSLTNSGTLTVIGDIGAFGTISDARLKTNVNKINSGLSIVNDLNPVTFNWKDDIFNQEYAGKNDSGFIAQEVEIVIPHAVGEYTNVSNNFKYKNMRHERIIPYLVSAIQELTNRIKLLEHFTKVQQI